MDLQAFQDKMTADHKKYDTIAMWHMNAHVNADVDLPYSPYTTYCYGTRYVVDENGNLSYPSVVDEKATIAYLSGIVKYARAQGYEVTKNYGSNFSVIVHLADGITIDYSCDREAVCEKKVVGKKIIPSYTTPERIEDEVEWDCKKVALLK